MAQKSIRTRKKRSVTSRRTTAPNAAGIDLGATVDYAAVPEDRDPEHPVRHFGTLTEDLEALTDWLKACAITTVAMEATGVYWIPLFQILEDRGFVVCLVNARHVKNVPGRKSDVQDCQWLQYLHSVGLLNASFRPPAAICAVRSLMRHRESLMRTACQHLLRVQKALDQMNVQLHHAVTDITGVTGLTILEAIAAGERDPKVLTATIDAKRAKRRSPKPSRATGARNTSLPYANLSKHGISTKSSWPTVTSKSPSTWELSMIKMQGPRLHRTRKATRPPTNRCGSTSLPSSVSISPPWKG